VTAKFKAYSKQRFSEDYHPLVLETETRRFWLRNRVQQKLFELRRKQNAGVLGFVEGPPTLNGLPHVGHARGRVMKDLRFRWKSMQGFYVPFWAGWDCQGLPVELEVEKLLGVKNKRELLEQVGEERFVEECKKTVMKYYKEWVELDGKLGVFMDHRKAYWTFLDRYVEREWQYVKRAWEQGLLEEGYYVVAYCPGCQTSLSNAEVGFEDSYRQVEDLSLYFKFKRADRNEYFLVWTTMPFTLVTDLMLAVKADAEYSQVRVGCETWLLLKRRVEPVMKELGVRDYEVVGSVLGKDLEGVKYGYPFKDLVPKQASLEDHPLVHRVVCEDFVDVETATGVVHLSPGNGEEDFFAAQRRGVPVFAPFDDEVKFTVDGGKFCGVFCRDADQMVVDELKVRGLLVQAKLVVHEYPTCWRSHHKLVWLARKEYFLRTDKLNSKVLEAADKVEYFFGEMKNRFLSFLREGKPWCVSRERVWGAPLPVWKCEQCGEKTVVASKRELLRKAMEKPRGHFELHKPWVDRVTFRCRCGGVMRREDFVLDTWHNSGASPYARFTDEEFKKFVPVDFLTEGVDQTRGWANSLLLEHVVLTGRAEAPFKSFLFQGLVQDAKGRKMSKSLGNMLEANKLLNEYSADLTRFYCLRKCSPTDFINFDPAELGRRTYQVLSTLYHLNRFFVQNAEYDGFNPQDHKLAKDQLKRQDLWLLSKLQETVETFTAKLESCEFNLATAALEDFVVETLSRLYVPMVRKELWTDDAETRNRRLAVYATLWHTLRTLTLLFNPVTPFMCEALHQVYRQLDPSLPESVNFEAWPKSDESLRNKTLEEEFQVLFRCVSLVYSVRQASSLKRRWPLRRMVVSTSKKDVLKKNEAVLLEMANVKTVEYAETGSESELKSASEGDLTVSLDVYRDEMLSGEGLMRDLARHVQELRKERGYQPTDVLEAVYVFGLSDEDAELLQPYKQKMQELVRTKTVYFGGTDEKLMWHPFQLDEKKLSLAMVK